MGVLMLQNFKFSAVKFTIRGLFEHREACFTEDTLTCPCRKSRVLINNGITLIMVPSLVLLVTPVLLLLSLLGKGPIGRLVGNFFFNREQLL